MNTWIFSKNGAVTEPLELAQAKEYVVENQDAYGWQSGYSQWLPVHSIGEFSVLLPERKVAIQLPKKIVDEFLSKEQALDKLFDQLNQELAAGDVGAQQFKEEIESYKKLTVNLNDDVKSNINDIEQQYHVLQKQLDDFRQTVQASQQELSDVVKDFNSSASNNPVPVIGASQQEKILISTPQEKEAVDPIKLQTENKMGGKPVTKLASVDVIKDESLKNIQIEQKSEAIENTKIMPVEDVEKMTVTELKVEEKDIAEVNLKNEKLAKAKTISTRAPKPIGAKVISTRSSISHKAMNTGVADIDSFSATVSDKKMRTSSEVDTSNVTSGQNVQTEKESILPENSTTPKQNDVTLEEHHNESLQTKLESGVKNIFKSVFTKEEPVSTKSMFAELIEKDAHSNDEKEAEADEHDDAKAPRRRRRR